MSDIAEPVLKSGIMKFALRNTAVLSPAMETPLDVLYYNRYNMGDETIRRLYANAFENIPPGVSRQLSTMVADGHFTSTDGKIDYAENLEKIRIPMLFVAAKRDNMAPELVVNYAFHRVGSEDKEYRLFARANKDDYDYGHCDLINGKSARDEVFPVILDWLKRH